MRKFIIRCKCTTHANNSALAYYRDINTEESRILHTHRYKHINRKKNTQTHAHVHILQLAQVREDTNLSLSFT